MFCTLILLLISFIVTTAQNILLDWQIRYKQQVGDSHRYGDKINF